MRNKYAKVTLLVEITTADDEVADEEYAFEVGVFRSNNALIRMMNAAGASAVEFAMGEKEEESDE